MLAGPTSMSVFNIKEDVTNPVYSLAYLCTLNNNMTFQTVWNRTRLFLRASFRIAKFNYACEVKEDYNKLSKKYPILGNQFDIWLNSDDETLFTPEIDFFVLELSFKE